ncbi:MAG: glycosyltransferase family 4 protein [Anaerolineales bacterium]
MPTTSPDSNRRPLRVCYFGTYRSKYSRNIIMIDSLRRMGVEVSECHIQLWHGIDDRVAAASGAWRSPGFWLRVLRAYWDLLRKYRHVDDYDVMVVGYPGQFDVFLARLLARRRHKPLVLDVFMSIYLIAAERNLDQRSPTTVGALKRIEGAALRQPDLLIQDTARYVAWLTDTYELSAARFRLVPTGADNHVYQPLESLEKNSPLFRVTYYGTFIPNHGVPFMLAAAQLLSEQPDIHFEFIGQGPELPEAEQTARAAGLQNITFISWMDREELVRHVSSTDVCLGAFGKTPQSLMTVQNKIYEGLAMQLPVISGDSPAMRDVFEHKKHLFLVSREDPQELAQGILELKSNPKLRAAIAASGYAYYLENFTVEALGRQFLNHLYELLDKSPAA